MIAAEVDYADAVQDLVPLEANLRDSSFQVALHYAVEFNSLNSVQLLLEEADDSFVVQHLYSLLLNDSLFKIFQERIIGI